jgi:hypothetical protein
MLQKEYRFLQAKYNLQKIDMPVHFLRMRPACFPTVRLAQLAMLMYGSEQLFSSIINLENAKAIKLLLSVTANDYWHYHFTFDESSAYKPKTLGSQMINSVMANTIVPVLFAYGEYHNEQRYKLKAVEWINDLPPENNSVTNKFSKTGISNKHASDSQALIELKTQYCDKRRCLDCAIGNAILKHSR